MWSRQPKVKEDTMAIGTNYTPVSGKKLDSRNIWPLALNLISCFLFMMNSYIVEPSSAYYASALGSSDALSGVMIGAAPWFAFFSAVGYSYWTNVSYKKPIIFAGILNIIGNLLYANAYAYKSMGMCLVGRSLTGLGAPRVINRRYVADATPFALRTVTSAAFAGATALGAALGPGVAIILNLYEFQVTLPLFGTQFFNGMTGPGYFMAFTWFVYTITIIFTFNEPNRSGLDELRERESTLKMQRQEEIALVRETGENGDASDDNSIENEEPVTLISLFCDPLSCLKRINKATAICMVVLFMKRFALEALVASTSVVTKNRFSWTIGNVGTLHLVNGIIVIPVSMLAGWLSQYYEDRYLALCLIVIIVTGMSATIDVTDIFSHSNEHYNEDNFFSVGPVRYVIGMVVAFSGIECCNPFVAALMSKVVPSSLAAGTFNSGLLSTLVGTSGRATGDLFITLMGLISIRNLLNLLIIPGMLAMMISGFLIRRNYNQLGV